MSQEKRWVSITHILTLMIIVQLTCNTHTILGGRLVIHDANMQYPPLYDIWMKYSCFGVLEYMCVI